MPETKSDKSFIPFSPPRIDESSIAEVIDTLRSGWITTGPKTKVFENKIKELTKATIRCIPLDVEEETGKCVYSGNLSNRRVLFAKAY